MASPYSPQIAEDPTKKRSAIDDAVDDAESYQAWMGMQDQAKQQAAAPGASQQPKNAEPPTGMLSPSGPTPTTPAGTVNVQPFVMQAPPPPPPPLPSYGEDGDADLDAWLNGGAKLTVAPPAAARSAVDSAPTSVPGGWEEVPTFEETTQLADTTTEKPVVNTKESAPADNNQPATDTTPSTSAPTDMGTGRTAVSDQVDSWNTEFRDWVSNIMQSPSRYDSDLVKQGQAVIEDGINRMRKAGYQAITEQMAKRGLTGSSIEAQAFANFEGQLQEQGRKQLFELGREQAMTWAQDLGLAGQLGLGVGQQLNDREAMQLMDERQRISLQLQKQGMDQAAADREADRQLQRELADEQRDWEREKWQESITLEYGGDVTAEEWDAYAAAYGKDRATTSLGPRPSEGPDEMTSDATSYKAVHGPGQLAQRQSLWDAFASKYGQAAATQQLGPRPTI